MFTVLVFCQLATRANSSLPGEWALDRLALADDRNTKEINYVIQHRQQTDSQFS